MPELELYDVLWSRKKGHAEKVILSWDCVRRKDCREIIAHILSRRDFVPSTDRIRVQSHN